MEIVLTDDTLTATLPRLERNILMPSDIDATQDVVTVDNNLSTYFTVRKRQWTHTWTRLSEEDYQLVRGFYTRQFNLNILEFPMLTITGLGVSNVACRMYLEGGV